MKVFNGLCHIKLVHGVQNDGWSSEEDEHKEEDNIEHYITHEPGETLHWQICPAE